MFTVEFEKDSQVITTIDEKGQYDDVELIICDDSSVYMRQFDTNLEEYQLLYMSYQQLLDMVVSLSRTEGVFIVERNE